MFRKQNGSKKFKDAGMQCVSVCGQVMCFVSLETWGRMCSRPRVASETSAALSILSKIIQKKGCCNSLDRRDGRVSSCEEGGGR